MRTTGRAATDAHEAETEIRIPCSMVHGRVATHNFNAVLLAVAGPQS
jgi:hypothetical protein